MRWLTLLGAVALSTSCADPPPAPVVTEVPASWEVLAEAPDIAGADVRCAAEGAIYWHVRFHGAALGAHVSIRRERIREDVPYELDWAEALPGNARPRGAPADFMVQYAREVSERIVDPVDDGYLIGFNSGEFGGSLWWYPRQPGAGRRLWDARVTAILPIPRTADFIVLSGIAHEIVSGTAVWVAKDAGQWRVRHTAALSGDPAVWAYHPDGLVTGGRGGVDLITWSGEVRKLAQPLPRAPITSVAVGPSGDIAIGRPLFVSLLRAGDRREEWFVPDPCRERSLEEFNCSCKGAAAATGR